MATPQATVRATKTAFHVEGYEKIAQQIADQLQKAGWR